MKPKGKKWWDYLWLWGGLGISLVWLWMQAVTIFPDPIGAMPRPIPAASEIRGVWITNVASGVLFSPWGINRALRQLSALNFNTVYPVVWNRGHTFYPSKVAQKVTGREQEPMLKFMRWGGDVLEEIIKVGHRRNLRVIPWFEYGFMAPKNSPLARRHPEWISQPLNREKKPAGNKLEPELNFSQVKIPDFIRDRLIRQQVWLNPFHPEVQQFILDLILEVVRRYDVDGIQIDDHFGLPVELGYDSFTVELYRREHGGKNPPYDPRDEEWMFWRSQKINAFMQKIFTSVKAINPECLISLSPNSYEFSYNKYLQDWLTWVNRGWVEELLLQVYRDDAKSFEAELAQTAVQIAAQKIPVGVGILTGTLTHPVRVEQVQEQVQLVRDRQFNGVSFFYWETLWSYLTPDAPGQRRQVFKQLFSPPKSGT
ncbi:MAG TPA: family 10 glycosylhydrolase [Oscillatoriaceae cyanobacterium M33_DOE_052]|uniref:Glycoside hydrolase family 10 protein n=1 Tax=Planktothricoides sp. SpSt-374 TaxID=2282167 RepID=A0A7C3VVC3_9CYAN|nr:family 10 glycosylhydrolase [Oscillatoriaceae cyanobacterium M33_DOE_052]